MVVRADLKMEVKMGRERVETKNILLQGHWDRKIMSTMMNKKMRDLYSVLKTGRYWKMVDRETFHLLKSNLADRNLNTGRTKMEECGIDSASPGPGEVLKAQRTAYNERNPHDTEIAVHLTISPVDLVENMNTMKATHTPERNKPMMRKPDAIDPRNNTSLTVESILTNPHHQPLPRKKN